MSSIAAAPSPCADGHYRSGELVVACRRMTPKSVLVEQTGHVLAVTLNRPEQRNAFDDPMRHEMSDLWTRVREDSSVRCVVLTGAGKGFCAGADMGVLDAERSPLGDDIHDELAFLPGRRLEVPVVVA